MFKPTKQVYYGVRYATGCKPDEFWVTYFTSSKTIKELISKYGKDSFKFEIRKEFDDPNKARIWENKVLRRTNAKDKEIFLNKTDNISINFEGCSKGQKNKTGILHNRYGSKNPKLSESNRLKVGSNNPFYGKTHSKEFLNKRKEQRLNEISITNGNENKFIHKDSEIPSGWRRGQTKTKIDKIWIHNKIQEKQHIKSEIIPNGWTRGRIRKVFTHAMG